MSPVGDGRYVVIGAGGIGVTFAADLLREEAREILTASGQDIADIARERSADPRRASARRAGRPAYGGNSTWQSMTRSSPLETDFLNGEIVLAARLLGRTAPANEAIAERAHRAWRDGAAAGTLDLDDLLTVLSGAGLAPGTKELSR